MRPSAGTVLCTLGFIIVKFTRDLCMEIKHNNNLGIDKKMTAADDG